VLPLSRGGIQSVLLPADGVLGVAGVVSLVVLVEVLDEPLEPPPQPLKMPAPESSEPANSFKLSLLFMMQLL
jgi:hypothetical protein